VTPTATRQPFALIGDKRQQYAWLWLTETVQTRTGYEGWIAYANDNKGAKVFSDRAISIAIGLSLLAMYLAVAAIAPMVAAFPLSS
jgi:uncharacterized membrane protein (DUF485 family)